MAEYYSAELGQKIRRGMNYNAEQCLSNGGVISLGYKISSDKHYVIDEQTAPAVQKIFEMYAAGQTVVEICGYLNEHGYKTVRGGQFNKNSLWRLLRNKRYIGIYTYNGMEIKDGILRIISDELFNRVQDILDKNKKAPAHKKAEAEYLLTTKLFCGHCKQMLVGVSGTSKTGKVYHYYKCKGKSRKECSKKDVHKEYIENIVVTECRKLLTKENIDIIAKEVYTLCEREMDNTEVVRLDKIIKDNERKQSNLVTAVTECSIESVRQTLYDELSRLQGESEDLQRQLIFEKSKTVSVTEQEIRFFLTQMKNGNIDDVMYRKTLINVFINRIYLYDDRLTIIFNTGGKEVNIDNKILSDIEEASKFVFDCKSSTSGEPPQAISRFSFLSRKFFPAHGSHLFRIDITTKKAYVLQKT